MRFLPAVTLLLPYHVHHDNLQDSDSGGRLTPLFFCEHKITRLRLFACTGATEPELCSRSASASSTNGAKLCKAAALKASHLLANMQPVWKMEVSVVMDPRSCAAMELPAVDNSRPVLHTAACF